MTRPIVALTGINPDDPPLWLTRIYADLAEAYALRNYAKEGLISRLADDYVALILVDGDQPDWLYWTATPSSSPATRRIPIFLIATDAATRTQSITSGADRAFSPDEFVTEWQMLLHDYARIFDPELVEQLDCECQEPLPPLAQQGLAQFNAGEFYKQHDSFEELWMATEGPVRDLYRAVLQVGVAYYQILRGNHRGALKMLLRSVQWLAVLPDVCQGIDVATLKADSYRVRAELETLPEDEIDQFNRDLLRPVKTISKP